MDGVAQASASMYYGDMDTTPDTASSAEVRANFATYLRVAAGGRITYVTVAGYEVAALVPADLAHQLDNNKEENP